MSNDYCYRCGGDPRHNDERDCQITALRAALDQERADNAKLRAFAQHKNNCAPISRREGNCHCGLSELLAACEREQS